MRTRMKFHARTMCAPYTRDERTNARKQGCTHARMHSRIHAYMHTRTHPCALTPVHTHTHKHTSTQAPTHATLSGLSIITVAILNLSPSPSRHLPHERLCACGRAATQSERCNMATVRESLRLSSSVQPGRPLCPVIRPAPPRPAPPSVTAFGPGARARMRACVRVCLCA